MLRHPDDCALALECLRLANNADEPAADIVERAKAFYAFASGSVSEP